MSSRDECNRGVSSRHIHLTEASAMSFRMRSFDTNKLSPGSFSRAVKRVQGFRIGSWLPVLGLVSIFTKPDVAGGLFMAKIDEFEKDGS